MNEDRIYEIEQEIAELQDKIKNFELDPEDYAEQFDDLLDSEGDVDVVGYSYSPSQVLKSVDRIAYRTGLLDYVDGIEKDGLPEVEKMQEQLEELESELAELEEEE